jgi:hydrogenase maturation protease
VNILVAGIGNVFLGDDGFGVEVVRRLSGRPRPASVRVADFGIRGYDLAFALLQDYEQVILVDAVARGGAPGTIYVLEAQPGESAAPVLEGHSLVPAQALELARAMGGRIGRVRVVGCEPAAIPAGEDVQVGLSEPVQAAVDVALTVVEELLDGCHA